MQMSTGSSTSINTDDAIQEAWLQMMSTLNAEPKLIICSASATYPAEQIRQQLLKLAPQNCNIAGSSSCLGSMNNHGFQSKNGHGLSLLAFVDNNGSFGVSLSEQTDNPAEAATNTIQQAIHNAGRDGELPDLVWLSAPPGNEEDILKGIASVVGESVPIMGGSSADNEIAGKWWQLSNACSTQEGILLIAMYPDCHIGFSLHSGYAPSEFSGEVTKAQGRTIYSIDNKPAAKVYNQWTDGLIDSQMSGGNILQETTFNPLGLEAGRIENIPYYALLHPDQVLDDGALSLFSNVTMGDRLTLMKGSAESLTSRAASVSQGIIKREQWDNEQIAGALVVYCAGCMLGINKHMNEVSDGINKALNGAPYQGTFTFGEQGCFIDGSNHHANLMISVIIFANKI